MVLFLNDAVETGYKDMKGNAKYRKFGV